MDNWLNYIEPIALFGTLVITVANLFFTNKLSHSSQRTSIMTQMRSDRIKDMRKHSAEFITCAQCFYHGIADENTKERLFRHGQNLISLLQYYHSYSEDIELIESVQKIEKLCLANEIDKPQLRNQVISFWWVTNVYIGADFERLKNESLGKINHGGLSKKEATDFDVLYKMFDEQRPDFVTGATTSDE